MEKQIKTIELKKNEHRFIFKYEAGEEVAVVYKAMEWVKNRNLNFDSFDLKIITDQLGNEIAEELKGLLPDAYRNT